VLWRRQWGKLFINEELFENNEISGLHAAILIYINKLSVMLIVRIEYCYIEHNIINYISAAAERNTYNKLRLESTNRRSDRTTA
jgi:hypothetical protein